MPEPLDRFECPQCGDTVEVLPSKRNAVGHPCPKVGRKWVIFRRVEK